MQKTEALHKTSHHRLADPAQGQADYGDAQLDAIDYFIQIAMQSLQNTGADAAGLNELLDARFANAYQGKLSGSKEGVGRNQEKNQQDPEQDEGDHLRLILTFQRCCWFHKWPLWKLQ